MSEQLRLMCVLAHPDDESMGTGGILTKYAIEGVETYLVTATRGERGWFGEEAEYPGPEELGRTREGELRAAAEVLGLRDVAFLDYRDGELDQASAPEVVGKIVGHIRRVRPHVVVTFDQYGVYGHPDHIALCQYATAAVVAAADPGYPGQNGTAPHCVSKLYYTVWTQESRDACQAAFGDLVMNVDGEERHAPVWPEWAITARVDTSDHFSRVWDAVSRHRSQLPGYAVLKDLPQQQHKSIWGSETYYRVFSLVDGGSKAEDDLLDGLREAKASDSREPVQAQS